MAAERRPYEATDTATGQKYLVRAAVNQSQALRAVTRDRFKVSACSAARVLELVDDESVKRIDVDSTDDDGGE